MVIIGEFFWVEDANAGRFYGEGEEGTEVGGDGGWGGATYEGGVEAIANGSFDWHKVVCIIRHYALKVLPLVLVRLLEVSEGGLGGGAGNRGESDDVGGTLGHILADVGGLVGAGSDESAQIFGAGDDGKAQVVKVCLGKLNHHGFNHKYGSGRFREVSPRRPLCYQ